MYVPQLSSVEIPQEFDLVAAANEMFSCTKYCGTAEKKRFIEKNYPKFKELGIDPFSNKINQNDLAEYFISHQSEIPSINNFQLINSPKIAYLLYKNGLIQLNFIENVLNTCPFPEKIKPFLLYFPKVNLSQINLTEGNQELHDFLSLTDEQQKYLLENDIVNNSLRFHIKNDDINYLTSLEITDYNVSFTDIPVIPSIEGDLYLPLYIAAQFSSLKCAKHLIQHGAIVSPEIMTKAIEIGNMEIIRLFETAGGKSSTNILAALNSCNTKIADHCIAKFAERHSLEETKNEFKKILESTHNARFLVYCITAGIKIDNIRLPTEFIPYAFKECNKLTFANIDGRIHLEAAKLLIDNGCQIPDDALEKCTQIEVIFLLLENKCEVTDNFYNNILPLLSPSEQQWIKFKIAMTNA
ncbi:hypothetical protein TVAG_479630 [Trichomonas vaginalis G3]|uniref:DUF3447 domain-containing protein n=1 Tax=Trichomonas vaginalis (strain ATCC PRA-98 / G3) TaxID=412133 RepID=A2FLM5_TRIV3|nr:ankyrin repeat-like family [Trichomonas vaginalis G3]EAX94198.1 hypothetical protein TVAG_479630 [Trichomonas vaginalis G3]KAI5498401.1 ankyrin repeat-like family [Trichomonas vaginalis G3]|eukprot:XP_001307128.1 hypothetical protein [Trichomonas vaginalis G3]